MQVFELHFNPKLKEEQIFDSFVYEPENVYEKKRGSIYMVGELQNTLPKNLKLLDNLAKVIKKNYYGFSLQSPEKALAQCLKIANEFLAEEVKKENVSWLGNLNFAVLSLKDLNLIFTKTGNLKILLLRNGQIIDIGKNLEIQEIEPYPLKIFLNVLSGKLTQGDIVLILTKEVFRFFQQQNLLTKLAQVENQAEKINSKKIKEILPTSLFVKGEGAKISGICFLSVVKEVKASRLPIYFRKEKKFSWKIPQIKLPKIKIPLARFQPKDNTKKALFLILILILILFFGFLIFREKRKGEELKEEEEEEKVEEVSFLEVSELEYKKVAAPLSLPENLIPLLEPDDLFVSYLSNFYFLDKETCRIIKYPYSGNQTWGLAQIWKKPDERCFEPKSIAVDGSVWLLNKDNSILRYHTGVYQETLKIDISPQIENITKIETKPNIPYLYLLEPKKNRVIITDKTGKIIKQFQSEKFDNLTDFTISDNGKTIYLKNNSIIYKIEM